QGRRGGGGRGGGRWGFGGRAGRGPAGPGAGWVAGRRCAGSRGSCESTGNGAPPIRGPTASSHHLGLARSCDFMAGRDVAAPRIAAFSRLSRWPPDCSVSGTGAWDVEDPAIG